MDGEFIFSSKGVYLIHMEGSYISSLTIHGYTGFGQEVLDPNYLPTIPAEKLPGAVILGATTNDNGVSVLLENGAPVMKDRLFDLFNNRRVMVDLSGLGAVGKATIVSVYEEENYAIAIICVDQVNIALLASETT